MKKYFTKFLMLATLAVAGASCEETPLDETIDTSSASGAVLYVTDLAPDTRVAFTDNDTKGISLTWEAGDTFTLYDEDDNRVDNFTCTAVGDQIKFNAELPTTQLTEGYSYTAIYPKSDKERLFYAKYAIDPAVQNGDEINNLDNSLYMLAEFNYSTESEITFEHQMAIMTFVFKRSNKPTKLEFKNGDETYTVNYSAITPSSDDTYTSHIMINPCAATKRDLIFALYDSSEEDAEPYEWYRTTSSKAYEKGKRYTASVSDYTPVKTAMFSGGDGSESNPYLISSAADMHELSDRVAGNVYKTNDFSGKFLKVTANINLEGNEENQFTAIGNESTKFKGTFDGDGYTISGLYINNTSFGGSDALFGYIFGATIKNLTVSGEVTGSGKVGGVVCYSFDSTVTGCTNKANVTSPGGYYAIGGVVGHSRRSTVESCSNRGSVTSQGTSSFVGGIVGVSALYTQVRECHNEATVTGKDSSDIGGIVGQSQLNSGVRECYNIATVTGEDSSNIGGIVGSNTTSSVFCCYNSGAEVSGTGTEAKIGGVVGKNDDRTSTIVENCYNRAAVNGATSKYLGGVVGSRSASSKVANCYWASDATIKGDAEYGIGGAEESNVGAESRTCDDMKNSEFVISLNENAGGITNPWKADGSNVNDGYPILSWQE